MSALRSGGWTPYDSDFDVSLAAETEEEGVRAVECLFQALVKGEVGASSSRKSSWKLSWPSQDNRHFAISHSWAAGWLVADGLIMLPATEASAQVWLSKARSESRETGLDYDLAGGLPRLFLPGSFEELRYVSFYDTYAPVPENAVDLLDTLYGVPPTTDTKARREKDWRCFAFNKCAVSRGEMFREQSAKCLFSPVYMGGITYPYRTCGNAIERGKLEYQPRQHEKSNGSLVPPRSSTAKPSNGPGAGISSSALVSTSVGGNAESTLPPLVDISAGTGARICRIKLTDEELMQWSRELKMSREKSFSAPPPPSNIRGLDPAIFRHAPSEPEGVVTIGERDKYNFVEKKHLRMISCPLVNSVTGVVPGYCRIIVFSSNKVGSWEFCMVVHVSPRACRVRAAGV